MDTVKRLWVIGLMLATLVAVPQVSWAASNGFLALDGIPGESIEVGYEDQIEVDFSGDVFVSPGGSAADAGPVTVTKRVDRSSPMLWLRAADGGVIATGTLTIVSPGPTPILTITLHDVVVSDISLAVETGGERTEIVSLRYRAIQWTDEGTGQSACLDRATGETACPD